jgi:hypothetical protein
LGVLVPIVIGLVRGVKVRRVRRITVRVESES